MPVTRVTSQRSEEPRSTKRAPRTGRPHTTGEAMNALPVQSLRETVSLTHRAWAGKQGVAHDHEESNWLHDHRPPALRGSTGAGPDHASDAGARAAAEDDRPSRPGYRAVVDRDECPRRQPAGRETDTHRRRAQLDRFRGPPGAGGRAFAHDRTCLEEWSPNNESDESFTKDPPNATVSVFSTDGSKVRDAVVVLKTAKLEGDRLTFDVDVLEGELTGGDGPAALFIDRFGFGGFHAGGFHAGGFGGFHAGGFRGGLRRGVDRVSARVGAVGVGYHPYVARGAWYRGAPYGAAAVGGAALGAAAVGAAAANAYPYCGYYPYPPCY